MPTVLYAAISRDGFIAGPNDETPWSDAEWAAFQLFVASCDVILIGRRTYQIMVADDTFIDGPDYIVVTTNDSLDTNGLPKIRIQLAGDMPKAHKIGIIGGGELNGSLAKLGVIDELILDIEPIDLKAGIKLFGDHDVPLRLELVGSRQVGEATVQRHYKVIQ